MVPDFDRGRVGSKTVIPGACSPGRVCSHRQHGADRRCVCQGQAAIPDKNRKGSYVLPLVILKIPPISPSLARSCYTCCKTKEKPLPTLVGGEQIFHRIRCYGLCQIPCRAPSLATNRLERLRDLIQQHPRALALDSAAQTAGEVQ
jgi:hypothetical protein